MWGIKVQIIFVIAFKLMSYTLDSTTNHQDFTEWNEDMVYEFLYEVEKHVRNIPIETSSKEQVIEQYAQYFTLELSEDIFDSLYIENDNGWKVPDGDAGYIFFVPTGEYEGSKVLIEINQSYIKIRETYENETNMYPAVEYVIRYPDNPKITEWVYE